VFVGSGIFKSGDPAERAKRIVDAVTYAHDPAKLAEISTGLGEPMVGLTSAPSTTRNCSPSAAGKAGAPALPAAPSGPYPYCPYCRADLETRRVPADGGPERRVCVVCGFVQWGNSKPTAAGIVVDEHGRLLLARRNIEPFRGWWDVPGGFLEAGEHPEAGVVRELREETGLEVIVERLIGVYMDTYGDPKSAASAGFGGAGEHTLNFYYACRVAGGTARADDDVDDLAWFNLDELPERIAFPSSDEALRDWRRHGQATEKESGPA
jgi:ADP-ribose pyrophosphatase YjhB (NUDIX family)